MVIGIGGISNAGKSQFARRLKSYLRPKKVSIICQDDYVFPTPDIPKIKGHTDWERPESINFEWLHEVVLNSITCNDVVIVEGIFAFYYEETTKLFDHKLLLTIPKEEFLNRKNHDLRWGKEPQWYIEHIWDSHIVYSPKNSGFSTIDVSGSYSLDELPAIQQIKAGLITV